MNGLNNVPLSHMMNGESFQIERLLYIPLTKQMPLYLRPYAVTADRHAINQVVERFQQTDSGLLKPGLINDISNNVLTTSNQAYETIINRGWMEEDRFVFVLKVRTIGLGGETNTYIQGFTNCAEISTMGEVAHASHDLVHHISSVIETTVISYNTPTGPVRQEKLSRVYDVITDNTLEGVHLQRPMDVIDNIKALEIANRTPGMVGDSYFNKVIINASNRVSQFSDTASTSKADNNVSSNYLTSIINTAILGRKEKEYVIDNEVEFTSGYDDYSNAEFSISSNRFLVYLASISAYKTVRGSFTFNDLLLVDEYGANNFELGNPMPDTYNMTMNQTPSSGEYWNQQNTTTRVAQNLLQAGISMVARYGFNYAVISMDNKYTPMVDSYNVIIKDAISYLMVGSSDKQLLLESLRMRAFHEMFLVETLGGAFPLKCELYIDITGDSKIYIEFADDYGTWYTLPTVANSYAIPVISKDLNHYNETTDMFNNLINAVKDVSDANGIKTQTQTMMETDELYEPKIIF